MVTGFTPRGDRLNRRAVLLAWAGLTLLYGATASGGFEVIDAEVRLATAASFLDGRGGDIGPEFLWAGASPGWSSGDYTYFGPLQSLVMLPALALSRLLPVSAATQLLACKFLLSAVLFPALAAAAVVAVAAAAVRMGMSRREAWLGAGLAALGTYFWHYARIGQEESLVAVGWAVWFTGVERLARGRGSGAPIASAGLCVAVLTRWSTLVPALGLAAISVAVWLRNKPRPPQVWLAGAVALAAACAAGLGAYNAVRFGHPLETGYALLFAHMGKAIFSTGDAPGRAVALLFQPSRGLFWFAPPLVLLLVLGRAWRGPRWALAAGPTALGLSLLLTACYEVWWGGFGWGPRFFASTMVLFVPQLGAAASSFRRAARAPLLALAIAWQSLSVVLPGTTEDLVRAELPPERCGLWTWSCSTVALRPGLAAQAIANTFTGGYGRALDAGETASAADVLKSSDYTALTAWPVRLAIRTGRLPVWVGLLLLALEAGAGVLLLWRARAGLRAAG